MEEKSCSICRRIGEKLFLKGERCLGPKCSFSRRGLSLHKRKEKLSDYALQLEEKQKLKAIYGLNEAQLRNYFKKAIGVKEETEKALLGLLERRLDNVIYRAGITSSRAGARQKIVHGNVLINQKKVNIPSYGVRVGEKIGLKKEKITLSEKEIPGWLKLNKKENKIVVAKSPGAEDLPSGIEIGKILEYYSR